MDGNRFCVLSHPTKYANDFILRYLISVQMISLFGSHIHYPIWLLHCDCQLSNSQIHGFMQAQYNKGFCIMITFLVYNVHRNGQPYTRLWIDPWHVPLALCQCTLAGPVCTGMPLECHWLSETVYTGIPLGDPANTCRVHWNTTGKT